MAASGNQTGLKITISIFGVLAIGLGVACLMVQSRSSQVAAELAAATARNSDAKSQFSTLEGGITSLTTLTGFGTKAVDVRAGARQFEAVHLEDGSSTDKSLEQAVVKSVADRDTQKHSAVEREALTDVREKRFNASLAATAAQVDAHQQALAAARDMEQKAAVRHAEEEAAIQQQLDAEIAELEARQAELAEYRDRVENRIDELVASRDTLNSSLKSLRDRLFRTEDISFDQPDGLVTFVNYDEKLCFINLGSDSGLKTGQTFSVYVQNNSGVGRRNRGDIKGSIEVTAIRDLGWLKPRITSFDLRRPMSVRDPIYSPIFTPGQQLEIALVGQLNFDSEPELDRALFRDILLHSGTTIGLQVDDEGRLADGDGNLLTVEDVPSRISERTRFLVIANVGDNDNSADPKRQELFLKMRKARDEFQNIADSNGVTVVELDDFIHYMGYQRHRYFYTPVGEHPSVLVNGGASETINSRKQVPHSLGAVSGLYSGRRKDVTSSTGATSKGFK